MRSCDRFTRPCIARLPLNWANNTFAPIRRRAIFLGSNFLFALHILPDRVDKTLLSSQLLQPEKISYMKLMDKLLANEQSTQILGILPNVFWVFPCHFPPGEHHIRSRVGKTARWGTLSFHAGCALPGRHESRIMCAATSRVRGKGREWGGDGNLALASSLLVP